MSGSTGPTPKFARGRTQPSTEAHSTQAPPMKLAQSTQTPSIQNRERDPEHSNQAPGSPRSNMLQGAQAHQSLKPPSSDSQTTVSALAVSPQTQPRAPDISLIAPAHSTQAPQIDYSTREKSRCYVRGQIIGPSSSEQLTFLIDSGAEIDAIVSWQTLQRLGFSKESVVPSNLSLRSDGTGSLFDVMGQIKLQIRMASTTLDRPVFATVVRQNLFNHELLLGLPYLDKAALALRFERSGETSLSLPGGVEIPRISPSREHDPLHVSSVELQRARAAEEELALLNQRHQQKIQVELESRRDKEIQEIKSVIDPIIQSILDSKTPAKELLLGNATDNLDESEQEELIQLIKELAAQAPSINSLPRRPDAEPLPFRVKFALIQSEGKPPVPSRRGLARRLNTEKLLALRSLTETLLASGQAEFSDSEWAHAPLLVKKEDGSFRLAVDYRPINAVTAEDPYPLPEIPEICRHLAQFQYFATLDMSTAFHQLEIQKQDRHLTAWASPLGLIQMTCMSLGLKRASACFQRNMDSIFKALLFNTMLVYIDDLFIFGATRLEVIQRARLVVAVLRTHDLRISLKKCKILSTEVKVLGRLISQNTIRALPSRIEAIRSLPRPATVAELQGFLGAAQIIAEHLVAYAELAHPLNELLRQTTAGRPPKAKDSTPISWSPDSIQAFLNLRSALCSPEVITVPDLTSTADLEDCVKIESDAACSQLAEGEMKRSGGGVGGTIWWRKTKQAPYRLVAAYSRSLQAAERNYSAVQAELLGIIHTLRKGAWLTSKCSALIALSDQRALEYVRTIPYSTNVRLAHWAVELIEHNITVKYRPGAENTLNDYLSRNIAATSFLRPIPSPSISIPLLVPGDIFEQARSAPPIAASACIVDWPFQFDNPVDKHSMFGTLPLARIADLLDTLSQRGTLSPAAILLAWTPRCLQWKLERILSEAGWKLRSSITWDRITPSSARAICPQRLEDCLILSRGGNWRSLLSSPEHRRLNTASLIVEQKAQSARKPMAAQRLFENLLAPGRRIELFARERPLQLRESTLFMGDQLDMFTAVPRWPSERASEGWKLHINELAAEDSAMVAPTHMSLRSKPGRLERQEPKTLPLATPDPPAEVIDSRPKAVEPDPPTYPLKALIDGTWLHSLLSFPDLDDQVAAVWRLYAIQDEKFQSMLAHLAHLKALQPPPWLSQPKALSPMDKRSLAKLKRRSPELVFVPLEITKSRLKKLLELAEFKDEDRVWIQVKKDKEGEVVITNARDIGNLDDLDQLLVPAILLDSQHEWVPQGASWLMTHIIRSIHVCTMAHLSAELHRSIPRLSGFWCANLASMVDQSLIGCRTCDERKGFPRKNWVPTSKDGLIRATFPGELISIDLIGPLPVSLQGNSYLLVWMDEFSRWVGAVPIKDKSAEAVAHACARSFLADNGLPVFILSDNGKEFVNQISEALTAMAGKAFAFLHSTAYHPRGNAAQERCHATLATAIATISNDARLGPLQWEQALGPALHALRSSVHSSTNSTPAMLYQNRELRPLAHLNSSVLFNSESRGKSILSHRGSASDRHHDPLRLHQERPTPLPAHEVVHRAERIALAASRAHIDAHNEEVARNFKRVAASTFNIGDIVRLWQGEATSTQLGVLGLKFLAHRWSAPYIVTGLVPSGRAAHVAAVADPLVQDTVSVDRIRLAKLTGQQAQELRERFDKWTKQLSDEQVARKIPTFDSRDFKWEADEGNTYEFEQLLSLSGNPANPNHRVIVKWKNGEVTSEPGPDIRKSAPSAYLQLLRELEIQAKKKRK
jgi:N6-adenosine-specific RNA methylase IME4